jgi:hypothetical protein
MKYKAGIFVYLLSITLLAALTASSAGERQLYTVTLQTPQQPIEEGSEVVLTVTLTNTSEHSLNFVMELYGGPDLTLSYDVEVRDALGREPVPTAFLQKIRAHRPVNTGSVFGYSILPGKSNDEKLVISKLFILLTGKYKVSVARSQSQWPNPSAIVKSNVITLIVAPHPSPKDKRNNGGA